MKPIHCISRIFISLLSLLYGLSLVAQNWTFVPGIKAQDIAVGKNGSVWAIETNGNIYRWNGSSWGTIPGGASRIAVDPEGAAWVVNGDGDIYKYNLAIKDWEIKPGKATDVGVGANGSVWVIGRNKSGNDYDIYKWSGSNWSNVPGGAVRIAVDPWGNPWVVNSTGNVFHYNGSTWDLKPGSVKDVGVGANGAVWCTGMDLNIYQWDGNNWKMQSGGASQISVTPDGNAWVVNDAGEVYHSLNAISALNTRTIFPRRGIYEYKILQALKYGNLASQVFMGGGSGNYSMLDDLGKAFGTYALQAAEILFAPNPSATSDWILSKIAYDNSIRASVNGILCAIIMGSIKSTQNDPSISFESRGALKSWCEKLFWSIKVRSAKAVLDEYQKWKADPCSYQAEGYKAPADCALKGLNFTQWYGTRSPPEDVLGKAGLKSVLGSNADAMAVGIGTALTAVAITGSAIALSTTLSTVISTGTITLGAIGAEITIPATYVTSVSLFGAFGGAGGSVMSSAGGVMAVEFTQMGAIGATGWSGVVAAPVAAAILAVIVGTVEGFRVVEAVKVEPMLKMKLGAAMTDYINLTNVMADSSSKDMFFIAFQEAASKNFQVIDPKINGEVRFYCQAGYVSSFRLSYTLKGQEQTFTTPNLNAGSEASFAIPYNATNIKVQGWYWNGVWHDLVNTSLVSPTFICYTSYGTIFQPSYKTDCPEVGNMATKANQITLKQGGGYTAWIKLTYVQNGQTVTKLDQSSTATGWRQVFDIPSDATNIRLQAWSNTGLLWDQWKSIIDKSWPSPPNECIKVYGTTLDPKWNNECN